MVLPINIVLDTVTGPALDRLVAETGEQTFELMWPDTEFTPEYQDFVLGDDNKIESWWFDGSRSRAGTWLVRETYSPSTDAEQAYQLIQKHNISVMHCKDYPQWMDNNDLNPWVATVKNQFDQTFTMSGMTPMQAAMRVLVLKHHRVATLKVHW